MRHFTQQYALDRVEDVVTAFPRAATLDPITVEWLACGFLAYLRGQQSLEQAFGLAGRGKGSARSAALRQLRDWHIARAIDCMAVDPVGDPWPRCVQLAPLARRFASDVWPNHKVLERAPGDWPAYKRELFAAMKTGHKLPTSAKQLHRIGTRDRAFSCPEQGLTVLGSVI